MDTQEWQAFLPWGMFMLVVLVVFLVNLWNQWSAQRWPVVLNPPPPPPRPASDQDLAWCESCPRRAGRAPS